MVLAPDFATSKRIYLSYAEPGDDGTAGTAVASATLGDGALTDVSVIYRQEPKLTGGNHFGSRIAFDGHGHVFISQGERNDRPTAQKLDMLQGKLVRLNLDGTRAARQPLRRPPGVRPEIWSYGHRNMQGLALRSAHRQVVGKRTRPARRRRDQPAASRARTTAGRSSPTASTIPACAISESVGKSAPGMEQPHHFWAKSPGLSGMAFYTGRPGAAMERQPVPRLAGRIQPDPAAAAGRPHRRRGTPAHRPRRAHPRRARRQGRQGLRADRRGRRQAVEAGTAERAECRRAAACTGGPCDRTHVARHHADGEGATSTWRSCSRGRCRTIAAHRATSPRISCGAPMATSPTSPR